MEEYRDRFLDTELDECLNAFGAVLIVGPKWCGKTTTASRKARSAIYFQDPDDRENLLELAKMSPKLLLEGENPRLIDEWQAAPQLWDAVRTSVDKRNTEGLYIMTGSVTAKLPKGSHSGTGRIYKLKMGTMSLAESGDSNCSVSLKELFDGRKEISGISESSLEDIASIIIRGGWPKSLGKDAPTCHRIIKGYCNSIIETEIDMPEGPRKKKMISDKLMRSLSRFVSAPLVKNKLISDISGQDDKEMSLNTLNSYLDALYDIHVLDPLASWNPNLRSKSAIRSKDTIHFCDPAIPAYFLNASVKDLMTDPNTFGLLFESLVIRDLRIYAQAMGGEVFHYHDSDGLEADAIIHLDDGRWAALEVKLGSSWEDEAAEHLLKLRDKVDQDRTGNLAFLAVVTASKYAYTRSDGVHVIPLACLGL